MQPKELPPKPDQQALDRERFATFLSIALVLVFGGAFVAVLIVITLGLFLEVIATALAIAAFVGVHYLIWGRSKPANIESPDAAPSAGTASANAEPPSTDDSHS